MTLTVAYAAAIGSLLLNGLSTVQQKIGVDTEVTTKKHDFSLFLRLATNWQYVLGTVSAIVGYGLSLVALQSLPLFLVQSLLASSVVVTALGESIILGKSLSRHTTALLALIIGGLVLLALSAVPGHAVVVHEVAKTAIILIPLPVILVSLALIRSRRKQL